jgi:hypothetical protein
MYKPNQGGRMVLPPDLQGLFKDSMVHPGLLFTHTVSFYHPQSFFAGELKTDFTVASVQPRGPAIK